MPSSATDAEFTKPALSQEPMTQDSIEVLLEFAQNYGQGVSWRGDSPHTTFLQIWKKAVPIYLKRHGMLTFILELLKCRWVMTEDECEKKYLHRVLECFAAQSQTPSPSDDVNPYWYPECLHGFAHREFLCCNHGREGRGSYIKTCKEKKAKPYGAHILRLGEFI